MILESAVINLTRNLDVICQESRRGISSHDKLKQEALGCLSNLLKNAPESEYDHLVGSGDCEILLSYLLSILCNLAKDDKSKSNRLLALETMGVLVERLERYHMSPRLMASQPHGARELCSIATIVVALPGVSSSLFRIIMSDTKLPKALLVKSIEVLARLLSAAFLPCDHAYERPASARESSPVDLQPCMSGKNLIDTCDNLATRIGFMLNYVMSNAASLPCEVQRATLDFCLSLLRETRAELVNRTIPSIVRFMAFASSSLQQEAASSIAGTAESRLKLMLLTDEIKAKMCSDADISGADPLDSVVLNCLFKRLDNLDENCLTMLIGERQSELAMLCGLLQLLPPEAMTTLLEAECRKDQLLGTLLKLVEFSVDQPFLFLTESEVPEGALEAAGARNYSIEKRFLHLTEQEVNLINTCCSTLGSSVHWPQLVDILRSDLMQFSDPNHLYIAHHVLRGCLKRSDGASARTGHQFTSQSLQVYREATQECIVQANQLSDEQAYSCDILKSVIAIETVLVLVELHLKFTAARASQPGDQRARVLILKDLLCPLLSWSSSSSRAVSEASLASLARVSALYGLGSTKDLIEEHTDYIVDGVSKMLDNFVCNPEVTNVLAITFKLSSIKTFCYFRGVYEQVFRVLAKYHHTRQSGALALLLYRTAVIINEWTDAAPAAAEQQADNPDGADPLENTASVQSIRHALDIDRLIEKLARTSEEFGKINEQLNSMQVTDEDERRVADEIKAGKRDAEGEPCADGAEDEAQVQAKSGRPDEMVLVERIVKHSIGLMSSCHPETKIMALKTAAVCFRILRHDENTLLPLVHQAWPPLLSRLTQDYTKNLEENLSAFECLLAMALHAKDFIKRRTLDAVVPRLCLFLETQAPGSVGKKPHGPYCMSLVYKCQLRILGHLGQLAFHTQIAYTSLWRIIGVCLKYLDARQVSTLHEAAAASLKHLIALDADCVWYFAKQSGKLRALPFHLVFKESSLPENTIAQRQSGDIVANSKPEFMAGRRQGPAAAKAKATATAAAAAAAKTEAAVG